MGAGSNRVAGVVTGAAVALVLLTLGGTASAAQTFHATPSGSGDCSAGSPCKVGEALALAVAGDTVEMAGDQGSYGTPASPLTAELPVHGGVTLRGAAGQPMPEIVTVAPGLPAVRLEGGRVVGIAIDYEGMEAAISGGGTIERVLALGGGAVGCQLGSTSAVLDSVCAGVSGIFSNIGESMVLTLRNATIVGTDTGLLSRSSAGVFQVNAVNTILSGVDKDIAASQFGAATVSVSLDHSNYETVTMENGATVTPAGSGANQTAGPLFRDAAAGDYSPLAGSPTIDAGLDDAANGALDLAGSPRALPARTGCTPITDIGAYEFLPVPPGCAGPLPAPPIATVGPLPVPKTRLVKARIHGAIASFRFRGSAGSGPLRFECKLDRRPFRRCSSPKTYKRLKPGNHRFSVRAIGSGGRDRSPVVFRFKTT
jgi:hypothetical protein